MAYLIGNLVGRLIFSYLLVLIVMFFIKKFKFKKALSSTAYTNGFSNLNNLDTHAKNTKKGVTA